MKDISITACVLAGGESRRFGSDKLLFKYNGITLIEHVINILRLVFDEIIIIANDREKFSFLNLPVFPDLIAGTGPIIGIYSALKQAKAQKIFCFPADMPNLNADFIEYMISISDGHDVIAPLVNGFYEPLHAIYTKNCLELIKGGISSGNLQIIKFYDKCDLRKVEDHEIKRFSSPDILFRNINSIADIGSLS